MASTEVYRSSRVAIWWPVGNSFSKGLLVALMASTLLLVVALNEGEAGKQRRRGDSQSRRSAAMAKARKQQTIKSIQRQVAIARQVLRTAESQAAMSQVEVNQAISKLSGIRVQIEDAHSDVQQAAKMLHEIEAEILNEQPPDSNLAQAQASMEQSKEALHRVVHRIVRLPDDQGKTGDAARFADIAKLSLADRELLKKSTAYQYARAELQSAAGSFQQLRQKLFLADSDWVAARQELTEAAKKAREGSQQAKTSGLSSLDDRQGLRKSQKVAAMARLIISRGEAGLRQLGTRSTGSKSNSRSKKKN